MNAKYHTLEQKFEREPMEEEIAEIEDKVYLIGVMKIALHVFGIITVASILGIYVFTVIYLN